MLKNNWRRIYSGGFEGTNCLQRQARCQISGLSVPSTHDRKINRLVDVEAKRLDSNGAGYERWEKLFNLKEAANMLNFLTEHGISDYEELAAQADEA